MSRHRKGEATIQIPNIKLMAHPYRKNTKYKLLFFVLQTVLGLECFNFPTSKLHSQPQIKIAIALVKYNRHDIKFACVYNLIIISVNWQQYTHFYNPVLKQFHGSGSHPLLSAPGHHYVVFECACLYIAYK